MATPVVYLREVVAVFSLKLSVVVSLHLTKAGADDGENQSMVQVLEADFYVRSQMLWNVK